MKISKIKKIWFLSAIFVALPLFLFSQNLSQEISDVTWNMPIQTDTAITVSATFSYANPVPAPFHFQIEYGIPETFTNNGGVVTVGGTPSFVAFSPMLTSDEYLDQNNTVTYVATNLWPSQYYYFDVMEWDTSDTVGEAILDYYIARTNRPQSITINLSTFQSGSSTLSGSVNIGTNIFGQGIINGMPIGVYLMSAPSNTDETNPDDVLIGFSTVVGTNGAFSVPISGLQLNQQYYLKLVNEISGLPLANSVPIMFNDQNTPPVIDAPDDDEPLVGDPDLLTTDEDFSNGLITCEGINETPGHPNFGKYDCSFEKLLLMVNKVINFLIFVIGVPIVALTFAYAGFVLVTSGGNSAKKGEAKDIIWKGIIGLIILLAAWLLVKTVLLVFGYEGPLLGILGAQ